MKLVKQTVLHFKEGNSDKIYEIDLCSSGADGFFVNFRYGKRGANLKEGSKTPKAVSEAEAEKIFNALVAEKVKKGYADVSEEAETVLNPKFQASQAHDPEAAKRENIVENLRIAADSLKIYKNTRRWAIERAVWKAGQLQIPQAFPHLLNLLGQGSEMLQYTSLWALGRCMTPNHDAQTIQSKLQAQWTKNKDKSKLQRATALAWYSLQKQQIQTRTTFVQTLQNLLPPNLNQALNQEHNPAKASQQILQNLLFGPQKPSPEFLFYLYLLEDSYPFLRKILFELLQKIPIKAGTWRALRHWFKAAEYRQDGQFLGLLAHKIEAQEPLCSTTNKNSYQYISELRRRVQVREHLKDNNAHLAFSDRTKAHFEARIHKIWENLGQTQSPEYLPFALALLLQYNDQTDKGQVDVQYDWKYLEDQERYERLVIYYDTYAEKPWFYKILFGNSSYYHDYKGSYCCRPPHNPEKTINPQEQTQAWPQLWANRPEVYPHLIIEAKSERIIQFALQRLRLDHPSHYQSFNQRLDLNLCRKLVRKPYPSLQKLALERIVELHQIEPTEREVILELLNNAYLPASQQAMQWLKEQATTYLQAPSFVRSLLLHPSPQVRTWISQEIPNLTQTWPVQVNQAFIGLLFTELLRPQQSDHNLKTLVQILQGPIQSQLYGLNLGLVQDCLQHSKALVQDFAAQVFSQHQLSADKIPSAVYQLLFNHSNPELRKAGLTRFNQTSLSLRQAHAEWSLDHLLSPYAELRQGLENCYAELWQTQPDFALQTLQTLLPKLLRKESFEGLHAWIRQNLINQYFRPVLAKVERKMIFRLLNSQHLMAQDLAAELIQQHLDPLSLSIDSIIRLANHELLAVRQVAWQFFENQTARMRYEADQALALLDAKWDDSRAFAFQYFQQHFGPQEWTPPTLVAVIDSVRPDVQAFGRRMLDQYFQEEQGLNFLLQLAQHPAPAVQQQAAFYLNTYASKQIKAILELEPYFRTTLGQVNKGRLTKQRVMDFLAEQALENQEVALMAQKIFEDLAAQDLLQDRLWSIGLLYQLQAKYPDLPNPSLRILQTEDN